MQAPLIKIINITKEYGLKATLKTQVLKGISLHIKRGDFIAIIGPSGSGKSTLMNIIGLLDTPTRGEYLFNNINVAKLSEDELARIRNREIGFVFQSFNLLPRMSVIQNVSLPAVYHGVPKLKRGKKAIKILTAVGLEKLVASHPNQLSGGQQQRVAIARALMNDPNIILADEPTGNLDTKSGEEVMRILDTLNKRGKTIILITHEHDIAKYAKRIVRLRDGLIE